MPSPWRQFVKSLTVGPGVVEAARDGTLNTYRRLGGVNQQVNAAWMEAQSASYAWMYRTQPAVRTVVDFHARNIAQLPLKLYERVSDTDRQRITDHPALQTMKRPNDDTPGDRFIYNLLVDFLVHENAYVLKFSQGPRQPLTLVKIPPPSVAVLSAARYVVEAYRIFRSDGTYVDVAPENVIHWRGSNPEDARIGLSKLETLRQVLAEEVAAQRASIELTKSGLQLPGYIKRPLEAPLLSEDARKRFEESWANRAKGATKKTPLLEEGMEFVEGTISPKDAELLASRRFTIEEVARVYGLPLGVIGLEPSSDLAEQRRQVYADVLPPLTGELACRLDLSILEQEYREDGLYYEFDLNSKLEGDLENRFPALTASAGRPWQTVNEVRAKENLPPIDGGDDLTIPLNVMIEGQGSPALPAPNVMPPQDATKPPADGSYREAPKALNGKGHEVEALKYLGVPQEMIWEKAGFTPDEVDRMTAMKHAERLLDASAEALPSDN